MALQQQKSPSLSVYILAGGKSRRFGSDKARALLHGQPLIRRLADQLQPVADSITVVADVPDKYADLGLATIADQTPEQGPLGGLAAALDHLARQSAGDWLLLLACDWVEIRLEWIDRLRSAVPSPAAQNPARAVAFQGDCWEPLLALYHQALRPAVDRQLTTGRRAMWPILQAAQAVALPLPPDWPAIPQINTPEQQREAAGQLRITN